MFDKRVTQMTSEGISKANIITTRTYDMLLNIYANVTKRSVEILLLVNGGGLITILTFLHDKKVINNHYLMGALYCFLIGLIITVVLVGIDYIICLVSLKKYNKNIQELNFGNITLKESQNFSNKYLNVFTYIIIAIGFFAAILFIAGSIAGIYGYYYLS